ncbi:Hypothetical predicted protein [Octopus vulgaris]|uniref:Reverse transcriptase/retrotransposon-derived protein RNase H-like domain-containing protein n=1 Tax=Octopus vulgaris TaxID=6645 RepID=A0AA36F8A9_OCTVU|nr:Hypothetical predicted protein [Octopus vulgaris]
MKCKVGESIQELATPIRQAAATCDFTSIKDPLDEALQTRFICSVNNKAVLKVLFKINTNELTFNQAIEVAIETENAAKVAKEIVYDSIPMQVQKVKCFKSTGKKTASSKPTEDKLKQKCYRCRKTYLAPDCHFKNATCNYCKIQGHLEESNMEVKVLASHLRKVDAHLQESCWKLCDEYVELFKPGLGCLQGFELDVQFKSNVKPVFCKPRSVPFTLQADLTQAINAGIKKGIWTLVQFNEWGTPVVPVQKKQTSPTAVASPLHRLLRDEVEWNWGEPEQATFLKLKDNPTSDSVMAHFNTAVLLEIACDTSSIGIGA